MTTYEIAIIDDNGRTSIIIENEKWLAVEEYSLATAQAKTDTLVHLIEDGKIIL